MSFQFGKNLGLHKIPDTSYNKEGRRNYRSYDIHIARKRGTQLCRKGSSLHIAALISLLLEGGGDYADLKNPKN